MNLIAVQTFLAIVECGSMVRASERLNVTQSTVTARLQSLESELGQRLLLRTRRGVALSAHGYRFRHYAEGMLHLWGAARRDLLEHRGTKVQCNLAGHVDLWQRLGAAAVDELQRLQPGVVLSVWPASAEQCERWLVSGLIDMALCYRIGVLEHHTVHDLGDETLRLYATADASGGTRDESYVFVDSGGGFGRHYATTHSGGSIPILSFGSAVWALEHILRRGGSAYFPEQVAAVAVADGRLRAVADAPVFSRSCHLVTNDRVAESWPWLDQFLRFLETCLGRSGPPGAAQGGSGGGDNDTQTEHRGK